MDIQLTKPFETIQLRSQKSLKKHKDKDKDKDKDKNYKYIYIGLIQVGIKSFTKEDLNTSILTLLGDARFQNFHDPILSFIESDLCSGLVSFDFIQI